MNHVTIEQIRAAFPHVARLESYLRRAEPNIPASVPNLPLSELTNEERLMLCIRATALAIGMDPDDPDVVQRLPNAAGDVMFHNEQLRNTIKNSAIRQEEHQKQINQQELKEARETIAMADRIKRAMHPNHYEDEDDAT